MCKWIRRIICASSLEDLEIVCDDAGEFFGGPHICYDGLVDHITSRHSRTLRTLHMQDAYLSFHAFRCLLENCEYLGEIACSVRAKTFVSETHARIEWPS